MSNAHSGLVQGYLHLVVASIPPRSVTAPAWLRSGR